MIKKYFFSLSLVLFTSQLSAATLDIEVQGITKGGILNLEISSSKETFESDEGDTGVAARIQERVSRGSYQRSFDIPPGTYAVKLHIDENENGELDTNFLGIPKEQYGISNNTLFLNFDAASFIIDTYKKIQIHL
tara:strand:+ start:573 stop:977 length:405 start_codon:yes stop_codon:yes gene_type:complete